MKIYILICFVLFLSFLGCVTLDGDETIVMYKSYYKFPIESGYGYFKYPTGSKIIEDNGEGTVKFDRCEIQFAPEDEGLYVFWTTSVVENFEFCDDLAQKMQESFTDKLFFVSDKYHFSIVLRSDFETRFIEEEQGVVMDKPFSDYSMEIKISAQDNIMGFVDLGDLLDNRYPGFSYDFASYETFSGVFVDESIDTFAYRHFFVLSDNKDIIYEAVMKIPSMKYSIHKDFLSEVLENMEIL